MIGPIERGSVERFRAAVTRALGLKLEEDSVPLLAEVLQRRAGAMSAEQIAAYVDGVSPSTPEAAELARILSVSETYFLRHIEQFNALRRVLATRAREQGRLRILSAGCASGEEAYSLAMVAREAAPDMDPTGVTVVGLDLDPSTLEKARSGQYSAWSLRGVPAHVERQYFSRSGKERLLDASIRRMVRFEQHNLVRDDPRLFPMEGYDVVFCRNVLMYFTQEAARDVVSRIERSLCPGGFLFLGHAETLRGLSSGRFHLHHAEGAFFYERRSSIDTTGRHLPSGMSEMSEATASVPTFDGTSVAASDAAWVDIIASASRRIEGLTRSPHRDGPGGSVAGKPPLSKRYPEGDAVEPPGAGSDLAPAMDLMRRERFVEALNALSHARPDDGDALLLRAALLVSSGDTAAAEDAARRLLELDELSAGAHYVLALCREHAGDIDAATEQDEVAIYLDRDFAMPYLHLGILAKRRGDPDGARRYLGRAAELLEREDAARLVLFSGGFSRDALIRLCHSGLAGYEGKR